MLRGAQTCVEIARAQDQSRRIEAPGEQTARFARGVLTIGVDGDRNVAPTALSCRETGANGRPFPQVRHVSYDFGPRPLGFIGGVVGRPIIDHDNRYPLAEFGHETRDHFDHRGGRVSAGMITAGRILMTFSISTRP